MTVQASKVVGLKVVTLAKGEFITRVVDVLYSPDEKVVKALLIRDRGLFNDAEVILIKDIQSIGRDAVIVQSQFAVQKVAEVDESIRNLATSNTFLTQTNVLTDTGNELGAITDIYFSLPSGVVEGIEVSQGGVSNVARGKKRFMVNNIITVGRDNLIVQGTTEQLLELQEGGLEGAVKQTSRKISERAPGVWDDIRTQVGALGGAAATTFQNIRRSPKTKKIVEDAKVTGQEIGDTVQKAADKTSKYVSKSAKNAKKKTTEMMNKPQETVVVEEIITQDDGTVKKVTTTTKK